MIMEQRGRAPGPTWWGGDFREERELTGSEAAEGGFRQERAEQGRRPVWSTEPSREIIGGDGG